MGRHEGGRLRSAEPRADDAAPSKGIDVHHAAQEAPTLARPHAASCAGSAWRRGQPHAPAPIRVVVAEDHELMREGLLSLLGAEPDIDVVGGASDGWSAVRRTLALRPDVVVMDLEMPRLGGIEATRLIVEARPATRVIVLSAHAEDALVQRAAEAGAAAYVFKQATLAELAGTIRHACAAAGAARRRGAPGPAPAGLRCPERAAGPGAPHLTPREAEILERVARGRANKEMARELGISIKTVEKHRQSLMTKLGIHDIAGLTHYAIAAGVVECRGLRPARPAS